MEFSVSLHENGSVSHQRILFLTNEYAVYPEIFKYPFGQRDWLRYLVPKRLFSILNYRFLGTEGNALSVTN
ncbi:MAG: hypothetical protein CMM07_01835 [Rhodopirellula sp.]|nr:hypothetical protein [Rhodopirellula sp.]